jgi:hypothetical protein
MTITVFAHSILKQHGELPRLASPSSGRGGWQDG